MSKFDNNQSLKYLKVIADVGNISTSADLLGITQPALSSYLKKIEHNLGTVLFDRKNKPLTLTDTGKAYLEYLEQSTSLERELVQKISDISNISTGKLTVGGASFFNVTYNAQAISEFSKIYSGVDIEMVDAKVPELVNMGIKGLVDVFITPFNSDNENFIYEPLLDEEIFLLIPSEWNFNSKFTEATDSHSKPILLDEDNFKELCDYPFIVLKHDLHLGQMMEKLFNIYNCKPQQIITVEQTITSLALTSEGAGVSLISGSSFNRIYFKNMPKLYSVNSNIGTRKIYIAYPRNRYLSKAAKKYIDILKQLNK